MSGRADNCHTAAGRGKLAFQHRSEAREAARNLGRIFHGQKQTIYHCIGPIGCGQFHLATRKPR